MFNAYKTPSHRLPFDDSSVGVCSVRVRTAADEIATTTSWRSTLQMEQAGGVFRGCGEGGIKDPGSSLLPASIISILKSEREYETCAGAIISPSRMICEAL